jgi:hypothetical protein
MIRSAEYSITEEITAVRSTESGEIWRGIWALLKNSRNATR